jgi:phosphoribosylformylglycinamidine synthase
MDFQSLGGLFVTLCESGFNRDLGFNVTQFKSDIRNDAYWFGEAQGRAVVSVSEKKINEFEKFIQNTPYEKLGTVTNGEVVIDSKNWDNIFYWKDKYDTAIETYFSNYLPE